MDNGRASFCSTRVKVSFSLQDFRLDQATMLLIRVESRRGVESGPSKVLEVNNGLSDGIIYSTLGCLWVEVRGKHL